VKVSCVAGSVRLVEFLLALFLGMAIGELLFFFCGTQAIIVRGKFPETCQLSLLEFFCSHLCDTLCTGHPIFS